MRNFRFLVALLLSVSFTHAVQAASGIDWLATQTNADGSYASSNDISTPFQSTSEVLHTLKALGQLSQTSIATARDYLNNDTFHSTEYLSRQIFSNVDDGQDITALLSELLLHQNQDGGFGELIGYSSTVIDTSFALQALLYPSVTTNSSAISSAVSYITLNQASDGSFSLNSVNASSIYTTAIAAIALSKAIYNFNVSSNLSMAGNYLNQNQIQGGGWETNWESALALIALTSITSDVSQYTDAIDNLEQGQHANGSWDDSVYITAIVLRSLHILENIQLPQNPDAGNISGRILNSSNAAPVYNASITIQQLNGTATESGLDGTFLFNSIPPGQYTLEIIAAGFESTSVTVTAQAGLTMSLGAIHLIPLSNVGIVAGVVTDISTGQPIVGADIEVIGSSSISIVTNAQGYFSIAVSPEPVTMIVSAIGYDSLTGSGTVIAGGMLIFSPGLYLTGTTPGGLQVTVKGTVVDRDTENSIENALVEIIGTTYSATTDSFGKYVINNVNAGELQIDVSKIGYQTAHYTAIAPAGSNLDLGIIYLPKETTATTTTITGTVTDLQTSSPIQGADIVIEGAGLGVTSDIYGHFQIDNITNAQFELLVSAVGYLTSSSNYTVSEPGIISINVELQRSSSSGLDITSVTTSSSSYPALSEVELETVLTNTSLEDKTVRLYVKVIDSNGSIIEQYPAIQLPLGVDPSEALITVNAGEAITTDVEWNTARHQPGLYEVIIQGYDSSIGQLLCERSAQIEVEVTNSIGGLAEFNPPITTLAAKTPVSISASIANRGNQIINPGFVTATVSLKNNGFDRQSDILQANLVVKDNGINSPRGMDADSDGNIYVANYDDNTVSIITPDGAVSQFAAGFSQPVDVDVDYQDTVYVLNLNDSVERITSDGVRTSIHTGVVSQKGIEVLSDGRTLIAGEAAIYVLAIDGTIETITETGLSQPQGVAINSQNQLFIANRGGNNILRYANNELSIFVTGINQPAGVAIDGQDNLYVTSYGDNTLVKIAPDKAINIITDGLSGPYDVKIGPDGSYYVSNNFGTSIMRVSPSGDISTIAFGTLNRPSAAVYDSDGSLYIGNQNNIVRMSSDGSISEVGSGVNLPRDILVSSDGGLDVLEANGILSHVAPDGTRTIITNQLSTNPGYLIHELNGDGFLVSENTRNRITHVDSSGQLSTYLDSYIDTPRAMVTTSGGDIYITNGRGFITHINTLGNVSKIVTGLHNPYGLAIDADGNFYTAEYSKREILKVDPSGNITVIASTSFTPGAVALTTQGEILVSQWGGTKVYKIDENGTFVEYATFDYGINYGLLVDEDNNLWASHYFNKLVSKLSSNGVKTIFTTLGASPWAITSDEQGGIYVGTSGRMEHISNNNELTSVIVGGAITSQFIAGISIDNSGRYLILDSSNILNRYNSDASLDIRFSSIYRPYGIDYDDSGSLIIANGNGTIVVAANQNTLAEVIAVGNYQKIIKENSQSVLLGAINRVARLDLNTRNINTVVTALTSLGSVAISPSGLIATGDLSRNEMSLYNSSGVLQDRFYGLYQPWGIAFDESGNLLIANRFPNNILRLRPDGKLEEFSSVTSVQYMYRESNGHILATRVGQIVEIDTSGNALTYQTTITDASGLVRNLDGKLMVVSKNLGYLVSVEDDWTFNKLATGMGQIVDIESDDNDGIYMSDHLKGVINRLNEDGSITILLNNVNHAGPMTITPNGELSVVHESYFIDTYNINNGEKSTLPISGIFQSPITGYVAGSNGAFFISLANSNLIYKLESESNTQSIQPGDIVYSATKTIPMLELNGVSASIDFGDWLPEASGDYQVEVRMNDSQINGAIFNSIHVGPNALGAINITPTAILPGNQAVLGIMNIVGADSTSITTIDPQGTTLAAESGAFGRAIAADSLGNIYAAASNRIVKITPDGIVSNFVTGITVGNGMAIDSHDTIYAVSNRNLLMIDPQAQVSTLVNMSNTIYAVATDYNDAIYIIDGAKNLSRVYLDGTYEIISGTSASIPRGLTIDKYGNFYILDSSHQIIRITPDGNSIALYFDKAQFEYEGVNVTADCSNNLLFAPVILPPFKTTYSEEEMIIQLVGDTGEVRQVLDGLSISPELRDMDVLFYDRVGQRLLIWTDNFNGKIFSFPIKCGGIDVDAHIISRADVDLSSSDPVPTSIVDLNDGSKEYIWDLNEVGVQGLNIQLNLLFRNLAENESRPAANEAFLMFNNSFTVGDSVKVPIPIPEVYASSGIIIVTSLDSGEYGPDTTANISIDITNDNPNVFDGELHLTVEDTGGDAVDLLPQIIISGLAGLSTTTETSSWNTGDIYTGNYILVAKMYDSDGREVASSETAFEITSNIPSDALISSSITTDRPGYSGWDLVQINSRIQNVANNAIHDPVIAEITVTNPQSTVIYTASEPVNTLYPGSYKDVSKNLTLTEAPSGTYGVSLVVRDSQTSEVVDTAMAEFSVVSTEIQNLSGNVNVLTSQVFSGDSNICTEDITNHASNNLTGVSVRHQLINLDTTNIQADVTQVNDLVAGNTLTTIQSIDTLGLPLGGYACVLQANTGTGWNTLGFGMFNILPPLNSPPIANAGTDQTAMLGSTVVLDGSVSSDPDGDTITYLWQLLEVPTGSTAGLFSVDTFSTSLTVDKKGIYRAQLIVNDGTVDSEPANVTITVLNTPPIAHAGPDQHVFVGDTAVLDGSDSSDADGDTLTYNWSIVETPEGSASVLSDSSSVMPTLYIDSHGAYYIQLVVNDGSDNSTSDIVMLTVNNVPPVAHAGEDRHVFIGDNITLDGSASSDVDGDSLSFSWSLLEKPSGSSAVLSDADTVMPSITIDEHGGYTAQLIVNDGYDDSDPDTIVMDVQNIKPVANAGEDQSVYIGDTAVLDATGSHDADGDPLTYQWSLLSKPDGSVSTLSDVTDVSPTIDIDQHGTYIAQLIVNDGYDASLPDTVVLNVLNVRPVADAGIDQTLSVGDTVILDGGASHDSDGDPLTYQWSLTTLPTGSSVTLTNPQSSVSSFITDKAGLYIGQLIVNDSFINSLPDTVVINSIDDEGPVTSNAIAVPNPIEVGTPVSLTAIVDDSTTDGSNIASASYTIDGGIYVGMNASDGNFDSVAENVEIIIPAFAQAGIHEICVHGTDIANNTGADDCILIAIYDPDGGFVTGGGWIDSPVGACLLTELCIGATGKANFGFVSKYKKGANIPTGETNFVFKAGDLHFHSDSYEWLVVANFKAMYKGVGTINDTGNYGFLLSAIDGDLMPNPDADRFRIKIWDIDNNDAVVYDNEIGTSEDIVTTIVGGGSIVIHTK